MREYIEIASVLLRREGEKVIVEIETTNGYVTAIVESIDSNFSHAIHAAGIRELAERNANARI